MNERINEAVKRGVPLDVTRYLNPSMERGYFKAADGSIRKALDVSGRATEHNNARKRRARKAAR